jgi:hypothetical protein
MLSISGDIPAVARPDIRFLVADSEGDMSRDKIPCLLVRVGVPWELRTFV